MALRAPRCPAPPRARPRATWYGLLDEAFEIGVIGAEALLLECQDEVGALEPHARAQHPRLAQKVEDLALDHVERCGGSARSATASDAKGCGADVDLAAASLDGGRSRVVYCATSNGTEASVLPQAMASEPPVSFMSRNSQVSCSIECGSVSSFIGTRTTSLSGV